MTAMHEKKDPNICVIMPCYNHSKYLGESIEGVLKQSYKDFELIIVDDYSSDVSVNIIENYKSLDDRIRTIYHDKNMGVSKSRNDALSTCKGKFIAFCDADDIWEEEKLEIQLEYLRKNDGCKFVYCDSIIIDEAGTPTGVRFSDTHKKEKLYEDIFYEMCLTNFINTPTVLYDRSELKCDVFFNEKYKYLEDWIYWLELSRQLEFLYIDIPLVKYRIHSGSTIKDDVGYNHHRINCYEYILNNYSDLPESIMSILYYKIGNNYIALGDNRRAKDYYKKSLNKNVYNIKSLCQVIKMWITGYS